MGYELNGRKVGNAPKNFSRTFKTKAHKGRTYEYIIIATKKLGRNLKENEIVHHRDGDPTNNDICNLLVLDTLSTHRLLHLVNCDEQVLTKKTDGSFTITDELKEKIKLSKLTKCSICGKYISYKATNCLECYNILIQKKRKFHVEPEKLQELVKTMPMTQIGKLFGVSDKAISKRCKRLGIEYR